MRLVSAVTNISGNNIFCLYDDGKQCSFPYPLPSLVKQGRLSDYAMELQAWLDLGNTPSPEHTQEELDAINIANEYIQQASKENIISELTRAKEIATAAENAAAVAVIDAKLAELE